MYEIYRFCVHLWMATWTPRGPARCKPNAVAETSKGGGTELASPISRTSVGNMNMFRVPVLLTRIFICISFNWDVAKLGYLEQVLRNMVSYPTATDICIVTNNADATHQVLHGWDLPIELCGDVADNGGDSSPYWLLWAHRDVMKQAYLTGYYTSYLYIEDDTHVSWAALKSWSEDILALEPLGFQRGIFRTETSSTSGHPVLMDLFTRLNITSYSKTVHIAESSATCAHSSDNRQETHTGSSSQLNVSSCHHTDYVQMIEPYQGMWIATHNTMTAFMRSDWWDKESALSAIIPVGIKAYGGYAERSTWGVQLFSIPEGFDTAMVVPYDPSRNKLSRLAEIRHLRNGYSGRLNSPHSKLLIDELLYQ